MIRHEAIDTINGQAFRAQKDAEPQCPVSHDKLNLKVLAHYYETHGFPVDPNTPAFWRRYQEEPEQKSVDLYALGIPRVQAIVTTANAAREHRKPYGLLKRLGKSDEYSVVETLYPSTGFDAIKSGLKTALTAEANAYFSETSLEARYEKSPQLRRNIEAFNLLAQLHGSSDGKQFINTGIETAVGVMPEILRVIPKAFERKRFQKGTPEQLRDIAADNFSFSRQLALSHLAFFVEITDAVGGKSRPIDPKMVTLTDDPTLKSGYRLEYIPEIQACYQEAFGTWMPRNIPGYRPGLGCLAIYSEAMKTLWNWNVDLGYEMYTKDQPMRQVFPTPAL